MEIFKPQENRPFVPQLGCPNPLSREVQCLLPDLTEAAAIISSLVFLPPLVSPSNSFSTKLQHNLPETPMTESFSGCLFPEGNMGIEPSLTVFLVAHALKKLDKVLEVSGHALY